LRLLSDSFFIFKFTVEAVSTSVRDGSPLKGPILEALAARQSTIVVRVKVSVKVTVRVRV
jgi:hypothetical protein